VSRILLVANTTWFLYNFRSALARALQARGDEVILAGPLDEYAAPLQGAGFTWARLEMTRRGLNVAQEVATLGQWVRLYRRLQPDLAHHFTIKPVIYGSLAARLAGVRCVVNSVEGLGYLFVSRDWQARLLRLLVWPLYRLALRGRGARPVFLNSEDRDRFAALGLVDASRAALVPGAGVDPDRFTPRPEVEGTPVALFAARMLWDKGVGDLVEAARILKARRMEGRVVLAGSPDAGNPASIPESQLREWDREGAVEWLGRREDIPELIANAHVVVLPSYGEGFPRSLLEGAASGRALVGADTPGCREIVVDGLTGLLVPPGNPQALAEAIEALWRSPETRRAMGLKGRELVLARFTEQKVNEAILRLYDDLLAEGAGR